MEQNISQAVIRRMPRYYRYLGELLDSGVERISSGELSKMMHVTASQIRQDLNNFGGFGQQGYGYNVQFLYDEIGKILGLDREHRMILIGVGNLGQALLKYASFSLSGFSFVRAFDERKDLAGSVVANVPVADSAEIEAFLETEEIDIAVIAIPRVNAQAVATRLVNSGIRAIWNFAPVDLEVPENVTVEHVHLQDSLMKLSYLAAHEKTGR